MTDLPITCRCGRLRLVARDVSPAVANHVVCECQGCRDFAQRMGATEILDAHGGTHRLQISPATLAFAAGREHLACMQQTKGGALRWYAACCQTPMVLTLNELAVPFVGIDVARVEHPAVDDVIGPVRARVNSRLRGPDKAAHKATLGALLGMVAHLAPLTLRWWWRGDAKRTPFYDHGRPIEPIQHLYPMVKKQAFSGCA